MSGKEIVKQNEALVVPDFLKGVKGTEGLENMQKEDIVLPRLAACQALSPQRDRTSAAFIPGLEEGMIFNTLTKDIITREFDDKFLVIPILYTQSRIFYRDRKDGGGILCRSFNGLDGGTIAPLCAKCGNSQFHEATPPVCTKFMNVISLVLPERQLAILSFKSKELTITARPWINLMKSRNKPAYAQVYEVGVISVKADKGSFYARKIDFKGFVQDQELYNLAKDEYDNLKGRVVVADDNPDADDDVIDVGGKAPF